MLVAQVASSPTCHLISASVKSMPRKEHMIYGGVPKMVGFPNIPFGFPTKNDHFGGGDWGYHHLRKHPHIKWLRDFVTSYTICFVTGIHLHGLVIISERILPFFRNGFVLNPHVFVNLALNILKRWCFVYKSSKHHQKRPKKQPSILTGHGIESFPECVTKIHQLESSDLLYETVQPKFGTRFPTQSYHCELPVATGEQTSFFWFNFVFAAMLCLIIGPKYLPSFLAWEYKKHWESGIFANLRYWYPWMLFFPGIGSTTGPSRDWGRGYQYLYIS